MIRKVRTLPARIYGYCRWEHGYLRLRRPKVRGRPRRPAAEDDQIERDLRAAGFTVRDLTVDVDDYWAYIQAAKLYESPQYYGGYEGRTFPEKSLEHYVATKLLAPAPNDVYIDIASQASPVPAVYERLYGCTSYQQDLSYPAGLDGRRIGGDAAAMPVPDAFATIMGLHCSFEHFEGDADARFIAEAARVLRPGGRVCILPLYLASRYAILTDPAVLPRAGMEFEPDAILYCVKRFRNRHARFYDVPHLVERIVKNLNGLDLTIYSIGNARDVDPSCYLRFAALLSQPDPDRART